jgi:hypothetical protein
VKVPVKTLKVRGAPNSEAATPSSGSWPPNHHACDAQYCDEKPTDTVDEATRIAHEQVHVNLRNEAHHAQPERPRGTEILTRVGIYIPLIGVSCRTE